MPLLPLISIQFLSLRRLAEPGEPSISTKYRRGSILPVRARDAARDLLPPSDCSPRTNCAVHLHISPRRYCSLRRRALCSCSIYAAATCSALPTLSDRDGPLPLAASRNSALRSALVEICGSIFDASREELNDGRNGRTRLVKNAEEARHPPRFSGASAADLYIWRCFVPR